MLVVSAYGATLDQIWIGGAGQAFVTNKSARIATVAKGATSLQLVTPTDNSLFSVGQWALMTGIDMQGSGGPSNQFFFEYVLISAIDTVNGLITISADLLYDYKSAWPKYPNNIGFDLGGPGTLYHLDSTWFTNLNIFGITINPGTSGIIGQGRTVNLNSCTFIGEHPAPSVASSYTMDSCACVGSKQTEIDKLVENLRIANSTFDGTILFQSASIRNALIENCTADQIIGCARNMTIDRCTTNELGIGVNFGKVDAIVVKNSTIASVAAVRNAIKISDFTSYANGTFTMPLTYGPVVWAIPGAVGLYVNDGATRNLGKAFTILDLEQSGTDYLIHTDGPAALATYVSGANMTKLMAHPCMDLTVTECTGCLDIVDMSTAPLNQPIFSHGLRSLTGNFSLQTIQLWGNLSTLSINVITPYTGVRGTLTLNLRAVTVDLNLSPRDFVTWTGVINLKLTGIRRVTNVAVTGANSGDNLTAVSGWLCEFLEASLSANIGSEDQSVCPVISLEVQTNQ